MHRLALLLTLLFAAAISSGQSFKDYLKLRHKHHVACATSPEELATFTGSRVFELSGTVKGSFKVGSRVSLMLEEAGATTQVIEASVVPDWLLGNEAPVRLLVQASRASGTDPLTARLLSAAPETDVARYEQSQKPRIAAQPMARHASRSFHRDWILPSYQVAPIYARFIKHQNPRLSNREATTIANAILEFSSRAGVVDARLIVAMIMVESGFDPNSTSRTGAMGLGQLMPGTAKWMGVHDAYDSVDNLYGTVKLVRTHLLQYRNLPLMLAAYNAGEGAVARHGGVPPYRETQAYIRHVLALYNQLCGR